MKRITALLLCLCLPVCLSVTAFAQDNVPVTAPDPTVISESGSRGSAVIGTTVPRCHTVTVTADGAAVFYEGTAVTVFAADRLSTPEIVIRPDSGRTVKQVLLNDEDITSRIRGGRYTFAPVCADQSLTVMTEAGAEPPQGKAYTVTGTVRRNGAPMEGVTLELRSTFKAEITDGNGRFAFSEVDCGKHSLTALENGRLTGYAEFILTSGGTADVILSDGGIYTMTVSASEVGIDLVLELTDDGTLRIDSVTGIKKSDNPQTGDMSHIGSWALLLLFSSGALLGATVFKKHTDGQRAGY